MMFVPGSLLSAAVAAALFTSILCMRAAAQQPSADDGRALLAKVDEKRLPAAKGDTATLDVRGTYTVSFANAPDQIVAKGTFRDVYSGQELARHTTDMGGFGKMEKGRRGDVCWEVDPSMGAKVHRGAHATAFRRYFTWMRGARVGGLYETVQQVGSEKVGERDCTVLKLTPKDGTADRAYVDADGVVQRLDIALPTPESADATFGMDDAMMAQLTFADWKDVDGVRYPQRRTLRMGPATVSFTVNEIKAGAAIDAATFAPPAAVAKAEAAPAGPAFDADGKPNYQIVEREAQPVASIRVRCKRSEIGAQLAIVLPEISAHLTAVGARPIGAPFARYHGCEGDVLDMEAGIPVREPVEEKGRIKNGELPAGKTVTAWHVGPYEGLGAAHQALQQHLAAQKLVARGGPWEVYWTDPGMVTDQSKWRTQLFAPIE